MKKVFILLLISGIIMACEKSALTDTQTQDSNDPYIEKNITSDGQSTLLYPDNEMIVQYDASLTEAQKEELRDQYGVVSYENCTCADPTLELWILGGEGQGSGAGGTIEEKVIVASEEDDLEGADFNPFIQQAGMGLQTPFGTPSMSVAQNLMVSSNNNVTIAVIDTGVDYNYFGFTQPFLYNAPASGSACSDNGVSEYFGWDFVNKDNDPFDDYGHGTIISSMISSTLESKEIDYQILPIKTFDIDGKGRYFDILCGFKYAVSNPDVDVVNMSFGWYNNSYDMLGRFITESSEDVLIITSAGNQANDNDQVPHYPSSYESTNILSVAALGSDPVNIQLASFSNRGLQSVDVAAPGEHLPFYTTPSDSIPLNGTSFSSAIVAGNAGLLYVPGMSVSAHQAAILLEAVFSSALNEIKYSSHVKH